MGVVPATELYSTALHDAEEIEDSLDTMLRKSCRANQYSPIAPRPDLGEYVAHRKSPNCASKRSVSVGVEGACGPIGNPTRYARVKNCRTPFSMARSKSSRMSCCE